MNRTATTRPSYLDNHADAVEEIGCLAALLADIIDRPELREVAMRLAAWQASVMRARRGATG